jgi:glycosyltransferase involved in cell wall biosynthesis
MPLSRLENSTLTHSLCMMHSGTRGTSDNSSRPNPIRVLHVVGILQRGGVETWLMHVLRQLNRDQIQVDFLVQTDLPGAYDAEVAALGCRIWRCPIDRLQPWRYARQFKQILREGGPYQIVHSHVHHFSGLTLRLAHQMKVPVRVAHSHNDTSPVSQQAGWLRRLYIGLTQAWIYRYATVGLAASREAAQDLFGPQWEKEGRWQLLYYGIDLSPFQTAENADQARAALGIPVDALVLGHVGRFEHQKNHPFLLDIAAEVCQRNPKAYLLMIGDGPLRPEMEALVARSVWKDRILFAGLRPDVPRLMKSVMDIFVLPSFYEGLPLVGIEAQAAGLPMVVSDVITPELDAVPALMTRISLRQPASVWAEKILAARSRHSQQPTNIGLQILQSSAFNITYSAQQLVSIYKQSLEALEQQDDG